MRCLGNCVMATMKKEISTNTKPVGKSKIIVLTLPHGGWEKFDEIQAAAEQKVPGLTHDMMVSTWVTDILNQTPATPGATVDTERKKLNEH